MEINEMLDSYANWLRNEISVATFGEYFELTTPYLDRFNDYLQIYVKMDTNGLVTMTDDGHIISNLLSSGIGFKSGSKRDIILQKHLRNYGLRLVDNDLVTTCSVDDFPQKKHLMVQAMMMIDDMFDLRSEAVKDLFVEDVAAFFDSKEIFYSKDFSLLGKTGSLYTYDFLFQRSKTQPERFCRGINKLNQSKRNLAIFNWEDTRERRAEDSQLFIFLNDENKIDPKDIAAFEQYKITPILFGEREKYVPFFQSA